MIGILEAALTAILNTIMKSSKHLSAGPNPWNRHRDGWKSMGYWATAGVENPLHQHKKELPFGSCSLTCNSLQVRAAIPALPEMKNRSGKNRSHSGTCCPRAQILLKGFHWGILHGEKQAENPRGGQASNIQNKQPLPGAVCIYTSLSKRRTSPFLFCCCSIFTVPTCLLNYVFQS